MVHLVKRDAQGGICLVETGIDPTVHHRPQGADLRILLLPLDEHLVGFLQGRGGFLGLILGHPLLHELLDLSLVQLVEGHIAVAHKVVALDARGFRGLALELLLPCQHGLADVDAAVVDDRGLDDLVAAGFQQAGNAVMWPRWRGLFVFGEENSTMMRLPVGASWPNAGSAAISAKVSSQ